MLGIVRAWLATASKAAFERWAEHVEEEMEMKQKLKRAAMKMLQGALTRSFERQQHDRTPLEPKHKQNQNDHKTHLLNPNSITPPKRAPPRSNALALVENTAMRHRWGG